jgi:5'-methylthioadenosine phosphorylase
MPRVVGIIGGSGVHDPEIFGRFESHRVSTPFGDPSGPIERGRVGDVETLFVARHGPSHSIPPHRINYRANVWALRELGATAIMSTCAVGSLREGLRPGDLFIPDQFIDFTKGRSYSFYDLGRTYHVSVADPFCHELRRVLLAAAHGCDAHVHYRGTHAVVAGPRFSTRAESKMFRRFADVVGMTLVPEAVLAVEAQMCYATLNVVTDYDTWREMPVDAHQVVEAMERNLPKVRNTLVSAINSLPMASGCDCSRSLENAGV